MRLIIHIVLWVVFFACGIQALEEVACEIPEAPEYGSVNIINSGDRPREGSIAVYACEGERQPDGPTTSKCLGTGKWIFPAPKCLKPCAVPYVLNGKIGRWVPRRYTRRAKFKEIEVDTRLEDNEELFLHCNKGYDPMGSENWEAKLACEKGKWAQEPYCEPASCRSDPPTSENSVAVQVTGKHLSTVTYLCASDFKVTQAANVICEFGNWKGTAPICKDTRCFTRALNFNGLKLDGQGYYRNGDWFRIECNDRYEISKRGNGIMTCEDGVWVGPVPPCTAAKEGLCPTLNDHGIFEISYSENRKIGSTARYFCKDVTKNIIGSHVRTCEVDKKWSGFDDQDCTASMVRCPIIDEGGEFFIAYSNDQKVHSLARYFCKDPTRVVLGTRTKLCLDTGEWSGPHDQMCIESDISCPEISSTDEFIILYSNGQRIANSIARYFCRNASQQISGTKSRVCLETGEWSGQNDQACGLETLRTFPIYAPPRENLQPGHETINGKPVDSISSTVSLVTFGKEPTEFDIKEILVTPSIFSSDECFCSFEVYDANLVMYDGDRLLNFRDRVSVGNTVQFTCKDVGLQYLLGPEELTCSRCRPWHSREFPRCVQSTSGEIICPEIQQTDLTVLYMMQRNVGGYAIFRCNPPAHRLGVYSTRCMENGEWADPIPTCGGEITCPELQQTDLTISYTMQRNVGSFANFRCTPPAQRVGVDRTRCLENGEWADSIPTCRVSLCDLDDLIDILPKNMVPVINDIPSKQVPEGLEVDLLCEDGLLLKGSPSVKCTSGEWIFGSMRSKPHCSEACMLKIEASSRLIVYPEKDYFFLGQFAHFSCPYRYKLTPRVEKAMCMSTDWSDPAPDCEPL